MSNDTTAPTSTPTPPPATAGTAPAGTSDAGPVTSPVSDWASDYDIFDPQYIADPYPIWAELRETCPMAHSDRWGGSW